MVNGKWFDEKIQNKMTDEFLSSIMEKIFYMKVN